MNTIQENNKLIAEFMNFKSTNKCIISETGKYFDFHNKDGFSCIKEQEIQIESEWGWGLVEQDFLFVEDLKFHNDWSWLMRVVQKINDQNNVVQIHENHVMVVSNTKGEVIVDVVSGSMLEATYEAVVQYIKLKK